MGGDSLCITKGIVSRLALVRYSAAARLLGIQIDAAINPGAARAGRRRGRARSVRLARAKACLAQRRRLCMEPAVRWWCWCTGNSGGPAFAHLEQGLVAGVAFSKNVSSSTDNIG